MVGADGSSETTVSATVTTGDGTRRVGTFPYPFIYPSHSQNPFYAFGAGAVYVQQPPANSSVSSMPEAVRYTLRHTEPTTGKSLLPECLGGAPTPRPTPTAIEDIAETRREAVAALSRCSDTHVMQMCVIARRFYEDLRTFDISHAQQHACDDRVAIATSDIVAFGLDVGQHIGALEMTLPDGDLDDVITNCPADEVSWARKIKRQIHTY